MDTTTPAGNARRWTADRIPDQTGRTFIVTGANSGLGYSTARELARRGAHVIMAVRNEAKGQQAIKEIEASAGRPVSLELRRVDLADLDSVRTFAEALRADGAGVDVLINNAGVMMPPRSLSPQGHESQFAANHLGHFALTGLLLDVIAAGRDPRVVTVSSTMHKRGKIHYDDLTGERSYSPVAFYSQSKFANILFGLELDRRLKAAGSPVRSLLAHPGYSDTNLQTTGPAGRLTKSIMRLGNRLYAQHADVGALCQLYAATSPDARGGQYIGPDGWMENRGHPKVVRPIRAATDPADARRLWELSEELTGVRYGLPETA
ncbi:oxidoreductase [Planobispora longispora]|uniref:Short-chain dehydrogenase n=1 Tax=Planobispora longispora TaxID=28887 RepID=A0A8J3RIS3_9ACTN|nr:oxidoreductase [Planobispora longispora]GIH75713.1 short-chain dehydrogenase [Planobispora longispora]